MASSYLMPLGPLARARAGSKTQTTSLSRQLVNQAHDHQMARSCCAPRAPKAGALGGGACGARARPAGGPRGRPPGRAPASGRQRTLGLGKPGRRRAVAPRAPDWRPRRAARDTDLAPGQPGPRAHNGRARCWRQPEAHPTHGVCRVRLINQLGQPIGPADSDAHLARGGATSGRLAGPRFELYNNRRHAPFRAHNIGRSFVC